MLRIKKTETGGPRATQKMIVDAGKGAAVDVVRHWHEKMMLDHFTVAGGKKYGYQKRKGDDEPPRLPRTGSDSHLPRYGSTRPNPHYSWRKRRQKRHNKPLVWSGQSEAAAKHSVHLSSRVRRIDRQVVGTAAMRGLPRYFYQYRKDLGQPDKANELTRVTSNEVQELTAVFESAFVERMKS